MRTPFVFHRIVRFEITVEADSYEEAKAIAAKLPSAPGPSVNAKTLEFAYVHGGDLLYKCLRCGQNTAKKMVDDFGWDGSCSNCGHIAQSEVGDPA